jgi:ribose transport system substrate-binding protein
MTHPVPRPISRRQLLRLGAAAGITGLVSPAVLAACSGAGGDQADSGGGASAPPPSSRPSASPSQGAQLEAFDPNMAGGSAPDLPARAAWANVSDAEFFLRVTNNMQLACRDRGLEFVTAIAAGDVARNVEQIEGFLQRGVCGLASTVIDPAAQEAPMRAAIEQGVCTIGNVLPPSHVQVAASQYGLGYAQGQSAVRYIQEELGGEAEVVYFNSDGFGAALIPRAEGARDALAEGGEGIRIVSDIQPEDVTQDAGFNAMNTILQAHPNVKVVLGGDTWVAGALAALEAAGKASDDMYLSGVDGEPDALEAIKRGGPYKASFAWPMDLVGYAFGSFSADWLEGGSVAKVIELRTVELNSAEAIDAFAETMANPSDNWQSYPEGVNYLGNISYDTRDQYLTDFYELDPAAGGASEMASESG